MKVIIGVRDSGREIPMDLEMNADELHSHIAQAITDNTVIHLVDHRGGRVMIPASALGFVQVIEQESHRVGFAIG